MQTIILCGGKGTRLREETEFKPKPMVKIGGKPILWHIMKLYAHYGFRDFILTLGYKGEMIRDYFSDENNFPEDKGRFNIIFADTGDESSTGARILKAGKYVRGDSFMVTYGDGVSDIDIRKLVDFHKSKNLKATITATHPYSKYGLINIHKENHLVTDFYQKPLLHDYISAGFMVFGRDALGYFDEEAMENVFPKLIKEKTLAAYRHDGFWKSMDTYTEMEELNALWENERPWAVWEKKPTLAQK
ncbi:MAG: sugar phosphate nucleotidyltransferase [Patescibacteria group bacterium]